MSKHRTPRLALSFALALSLTACQTAQISQQAQAEAEADWRECMNLPGERQAEYCQNQYDQKTAAAKTNADDGGVSGLWWKIPLVVVAVPVLLVAAAYAGGGSGGNRYKGYKTYKSTYRSPYGNNLNSHAKCNAGIDRSCDGSEV
jgi:hypothetical protein